MKLGKAAYSAASRVRPWERQLDELTPVELEELQQTREITMPIGAVDLAVPEQRPSLPVASCGNPECSVCATRTRRYW
jgi:hypothetical protein